MKKNAELFMLRIIRLTERDILFGKSFGTLLTINNNIIHLISFEINLLK